MPEFMAQDEQNNMIYVQYEHNKNMGEINKNLSVAKEIFLITFSNSSKAFIDLFITPIRPKI